MGVFKKMFCRYIAYKVHNQLYNLNFIQVNASISSVPWVVTENVHTSRVLVASIIIMGYGGV